MTRLIGEELFKLRTTPAGWVALAVTVGLGLTSVLSNILVPVPPGRPSARRTTSTTHCLSPPSPRW